ncbi:unnamed protein product [Vitrella brassicaformis CCMP3155]|uniref:Uncharacterized protein n=1 Tax=Vitrella brassicaformis (strain CCMP3155) TaxID=1169540 RepID=A0A0G4FS66_VITBC|nr:unnamed protein product [Vitrella brassicaformis CCMP3155]|eukprot:CEM17529.1 unnamed protein product [Vitrella brassicaformis CCMP3155]
MSRSAALWNVRILWPRYSRFLFNTYRGHAALYMRDQSAPLWRREGTTQGDPLASLFYSVATLPLVWEMKRPAEEGPQAWFADDSAKRRGPLRGYHSNGKKTKLVVRAGCEERAQEVFGDTDVEIVSGARYMGGFVGTAEGKRAYAAERVQEWQRCVNRMADAAARYPQAAHTALTTSLQAEWDFFMRSAPLWSREGTTQGDPLASLFYSVATLPLVWEMKRPAEEGPQAWFADDSAKRRGPLRGYHPNGKKTKLVVRAGCEERAREVFGDTDVEIVSGARYMGGFVGTAEVKRAYATERVQEWQRCVNRMADAAARYPQAAHTALTTSLQAEWDFFMRVMPEERATFEPLRYALTHYLTQLSSHAVTATEAQLMMLPARHGGMGVRDPTERVAAAYKTSTKGTSLLVSTIQNGDPPDGPPFNPFQHRAEMQQVVKEGRRATDEAAKERFEDGLQQLPPERRRAVHRAIEAKTAGWVTCRPDAEDHTDLTPDEFRDNMAIRYAYEPPKMPTHCDGCGAAYSLDHALNCGVGGLVIRRHNEVVDVLCDLSAKAWGESAVRKEVVIVEPEEEGEKGVRTDMVVIGVWERQKDVSFDVCVTNADAPSYRKQSTASILKSKAKTKKAHHSRVWCVTVDGVWGREANGFFSRLVEKLRTKAAWADKSYGQVMGWVRARLSIALARSASMCVRGGRRRWKIH